MVENSQDDVLHFDPTAKASVEPGRRLLNIDFRVIQRHGYLSPFASRSQIAEEYRTIKRPLLKNAFSQGAEMIEKGNLIMVSSANPGEGKTFNALNLALSISMEKDKTVLLVDADVLKPSLSRFLGMKEEAGLVDYLLDDDMRMEDIVFSSNLPSLSLIPAGRSYERTSELLTSNAMVKMISDMAARYPDRIVLLDAPPLLITNEASVLAELAGQIVMVVESGVTLRSDVQDAIEKLPADAHLSFILNKSKHVATAAYYGS